jgi:hypothetical protein
LAGLPAGWPGKTGHHGFIVWSIFVPAVVFDTRGIYPIFAWRLHLAMRFLPEIGGDHGKGVHRRPTCNYKHDGKIIIGGGANGGV